jgi:repressor LexA
MSQPRPSTKPLSPKELSVLKFIEFFIGENGFSPTFTEIRDHFEFASINSVQNYIKQLSSKGYISVPGGNLKRAIEIINSITSTSLYNSNSLSQSHNSKKLSKLSTSKKVIKTDNINSLVADKAVSIPLLGRVAAGKPIDAINHNEFLDVPSSLIKSPKNSFALQVVGNSMVDDGILDGDLILIHEQPTANNGDTVVAVVNEEATLKRFFNPTTQSAGCVELRPANSQMKSFWLKPNEVTIKGKLVGLIRKF